MLCLHNGMKYDSSIKRNSGHHWSEACSETNQSKSRVLYESIYVKYPEKNTESRLVIARGWSWTLNGRQANRTGLLRLTETTTTAPNKQKLANNEPFKEIPEWVPCSDTVMLQGRKRQGRTRLPPLPELHTGCDDTSPLSRG